jgi:endogenous inhibitor of DNA gyrase (YacG/DUF329 family)
LLRVLTPPEWSAVAKTVTCPTCSKLVPWVPESRWRPFCSERCRLIDLGEWLDEGHRIAGPTETPVHPESEDDFEDTRPH